MPRSVFRPCIDLHDGQVKQIVGGTLSETEPTTLKTNFTSSETPAYYADLYRKHNLTGGHVIKLGKGNEVAAKEAISAWPGGMQVGGGITIDNAQEWLDAGADKVIVTSWLFPEATFSLERLTQLSKAIGRDRLVVDLSCRRRENQWVVAMNKWQTLTNLSVTQETLALLGEHCSEFLIHAADVEGLCQGIDEDLVRCLGEWTTLPMTYAGGAKSVEDLALVNELSQGHVNLTFGSALDIFGGKAVRFAECVKWNQQERDA
ncbi:Phosphoribosylformimino-5-aminoimidazole carboxamide ribotide isomerase [Piptocephalis cylindrospora]|uniref:1-(5-phosphoribosyl)-5-[(5-phosphoribosylamino)methylideneamino] imidazole-4-carboxamide isomerase n=1 Tax=Piptocephalis cylindrospora TaxID=1907219 RepID=A0A4P9Y478_9FUNG|nr:Phosphoribosylformimino-5-aminoimidazole carboxamide ribotide isomerase [Piptocephalis cylindrospora]|eukprot:RKP13715.1 Phosphoribosylformimino-5-aminoimidazole carboxamide ribotide isomerase [Piptocephalis cylindrospora]